AARSPGRRLRIALPGRSERVVALPLLRVGEHLVGFVDLLEAFGGVLALRDVRMVLPSEAPISGLNGLVVRLSVDAENPVVVLEVYRHWDDLNESIADRFSDAR